MFLKRMKTMVNLESGHAGIPSVPRDIVGLWHECCVLTWPVLRRQKGRALPARRSLLPRQIRVGYPRRCGHFVRRRAALKVADISSWFGFGRNADLNARIIG